MISERRLRELLLDAPVPGQSDAELRAEALVAAAYAGRPRERRSPAPRLALALAAALVLAVLVLSPAGASVRSWVGDVFATETPVPAPALTEVPGGGRLLVRSEEGAWVVQPDGSRRLLGSYDEVSWSPRGLFVAAAAGHTLSAIEPDGTVHWTVSAPGPVSDPRWSPSGFRIAYRSGDSLRVVGADGEGDHLLARVAAPIPPAWFPAGLQVLAYVNRGGRLAVVEADSRRELGSAPALAGVETIAWSADGTALIEASPRSLRVRPVEISKVSASVRLEAPREIPLPPGATVEAAVPSTRGREIAVLLRLPGGGERPSHTEVALVDPSGGLTRRLLAVPGGLAPVHWSPDGDRLLIPWPGLDEWLFIPTAGGGPGRAFAPISPEFAPGSGAAGAGFPSVEGWCCAQEASRGAG